MNRIISIDTKKWYRNMSIVLFLATIISSMLSKEVEPGDVLFFNFAYHMCFWLFTLGSKFLLETVIEKKTYNKYFYAFYAIFLLIFGLLAIASSILNLLVKDYAFALLFCLFSSSPFLAAVHLLKKSKELVSTS